MYTVGRTGKEDGDQPSVAASRGHVARLSAGPYVALWDDSRPECCERMGSGCQEKRDSWCGIKKEVVLRR